MNIFDFLIKTSLFKNLPRAQVERVAQFIVVKRYAKNATVFVEGQKADYFYIVYSGKVKIYKLSHQGKEQILRIMESTDIVAQVPIFTGENYPANCATMEPTVLLALAREQLIHLIKTEPQIALNLLALQAKRLHELTLQVENLTVKDTTPRLLKYMLERCGVDGIVKMDLSLSALAKLLGVTRENLSRTISKLAKAKLIAYTDKQLKIINIEKLKQRLG